MDLPLHSFDFMKLPLEIRLHIWNYACIFEGRRTQRVQRIAKDVANQIQSYSEPWEMCVIPAPRYPVPSLLHVFAESRRSALGHWELWRCANPYTHQREDRWIYVNRWEDLFYFANGTSNDFWCLSVLDGLEMPMSTKMDMFERFQSFTTGIRHWAIDWWCYLDGAVHYGDDRDWFLSLFQDDEGDLTVVIKNPHHPEGLRRVPPNAMLQLENITPGTVRAKTADVILRHVLGIAEDVVAEGDTETSKVGESRPAVQRSTCWPRFLPNLRAMSAVVDRYDDENSEEDEKYLKSVKMKCAWHQSVIQMTNLRAKQRRLFERMRHGSVTFPGDIEWID